MLRNPLTTEAHQGLLKQKKSPRMMCHSRAYGKRAVEIEAQTLSFRPQIYHQRHHLVAQVQPDVGSSSFIPP